jgi:hypothetical protein
LPMMDELGFGRVKESLHRGIVIEVALSTHRCLEVGGLHHSTILR